MGACCGKNADPEDQKWTKGGANDVTHGPVKNRGCTDIPCLLIYLAFWFLFAAVTFMGFADGSPAKLYKPRDYKGDYCGIEKQWNGGLDLTDHTQRTYTMNVTETVDMIAKQLVCSTAAEYALDGRATGTALMTPAQLSTYRCACCKDACPSCSGSLALGDLSTGGAISSTIGGKMGELTGGAGTSASLFSSNSFNGDFVSNVWKEATRYFTAVCLPKCTTPATDVTNGTRNYTYLPSPNVAWYTAWKVLKENENVPAQLRTTINTQFTFKTLPLSLCPYEARYCVPFPGVSFKEVANDYCTFEMAAAVVASIGAASSEAYEQLGANDLVDNMGGSLGDAVGDFMNTLDAFAIVCTMSLVIGLVFLILLRFLVGFVVWFSIFGVLCMFLLAGGLFYVRSSQCQGAGLFDSGKNMGSAALVTASSQAQNAAGNGAVLSEDMTGNGADYRGAQKTTESGRSCQAWAVQTPHNHSTSPSLAKFNKSGLVDNYCRNPEDAPTIWCFTTDPAQRWELCKPIGVIKPECAQGYVVASETFRKILEVLAYVLWVMAFLWVVLVICLCKQIRLAIGINKVAAMFVYNTPSILFVPLVQILVGVCWFLIWSFCASFLLSQVPEDYTPTGAYESWAVAYGTEDVPGKCTDKPSAGFPWKYEGNLALSDDPCSGNKGDVSGMTPKCWMCAPPRYAFDQRFAISFFSYLWNAAFLIAIGQCTIAGAVGVWFFTAHADKRKTSAVRNGLRNSFRYHAGSLAFGSFILAVVQFIKYFCKYLEQQAKAQKNKVMVIVMKILQYCLWCIEKCIKFLNKNAYIQIALLGKNFCTSAKNAFFLIARNFARFGAVAMLGSIIHFLGFIFIMAATAGCGYFILQALHEEVTPVVPLLAYIAIGYLVANLYMNVFGLAVDTILHCFIATEEMGEPVDAFVPKPLLTFLGSCGAGPAEGAEGGGAWGG